MPRFFVCLALWLGGAGLVQAQFTDTFADGDFTANPSWSGEPGRFTVVPFGADFGLQANGPVASDTLYLSTPSMLGMGTWQFTLRYTGGQLSNFNLVRVYLIADAANLRGDVQGYYVQVGTNDRDVRLYRSDPAASGGRVLIGQSAANTVAEAERTLVLRIQRSAASLWTVALDGQVLFTASETGAAFATSTHFGVWIKHSSSRSQGYLFDDVSATAETGTGGTDTTPPTLLGATYADGQVTLVFSEPLDDQSIALSAFNLIGLGPPQGFSLPSPSTVQLTVGTLPPGTYTLTVEGLTDTSGNPLAPGTTATFTVEGTVPGAVPQPRDVVVNELLYDPPSGGSEFVELYNRSSETFDLRRFSLADNRLEVVPIIGTAQSLPPGTWVVLVQNGGNFAAAFPGVPFIEVAGWPALNNTGDTAVLLFDEAVVDSVAYAPAWGGSDVSLERKDPNGPSSSAVNWASSVDPRSGTPGQQNSVFAPDTAPPQGLLAEQVSNTLLEVFFDEPLDPASATPTHFALDGLQPSLVQLTGDGATARLTFASTTGNTLTLADVRDLTGNVLAGAALPVARLAAPGDVVVNEVMFAPRADPFDNRIDQPEYIELFNVRAYPVSLRGFYWTDVPDENGVADTTRFVFRPAALPPGGYAVIFSQPVALPVEDLFSQSQLVLAFPMDYRALGTTLLPVAGSSLGLLNSGDLLRLHRADNTPIESVFYDPAWHSAALASTTGIALERLAATGSPADALNWASSLDPRGGTPGQANSGTAPTAFPPNPGEILVNEIMFEPRADDDDFQPDQPEYFELLNPGTAPVELNGLLMTNQPDETGAADTLRLVYHPTVLPPGGYAVVYSVPTTVPDDSLVLALTDAFPALADANAVLLPLRASLGLDNSGDLIRLHRPDGVVLDAVAYETGWHAAALNSTRGISLERLSADGRTDDPENWTSSVDAAGGTPGLPNSVTVPPGSTLEAPGLVVTPSPFSPDRDGFDDVAVLRFTLQSEAALLRVRIYDASGRLVRTLTEATLAARTGTLLWDGLDDAGRTLRIGIYVVHLEAVSAERGTTEAYKQALVLARTLN
jgi:hypothetical protein